MKTNFATQLLNWANYIIVLVLNSNYMFTSVFFTLQISPCFF